MAQLKGDPQLGTDECNWLDHTAIDQWVNEWEADVTGAGIKFTGSSDPLDELRHRIARGDFSDKKVASIQAYIAQREARNHRLSEQGKAEREERSVNAAERSAEAAALSARWAMWAIVISIAALLISAWPIITRHP